MGGRYAAPRRRRQPMNWAATVAGCLVAAVITQMTPAQAETTVPADGVGSFGSVSVGKAPRPPRGPVPGVTPKSTPATPTSRSRTLQVHYAAPVRTASGVIDIVRTLERVTARGSRTYSYLIYPRAGYRPAQDWRTFPAFLAAAQARGINVHITLTPPFTTSTDDAPCTANRLLPFRGNYDTWMREIGKLAKRFPNLTAVAMDDFAYDTTIRDPNRCNLFAPGTITRWKGILRTQAGRPISVMPVLYFRDVAGRRAIYPAIKSETTEVIWPFTQIGSGLLEQQYLLIRKEQPKLKIYVMVYANGFKGVVPTPATIRSEVAAAKRLGAAGVIVYQESLN